MPRRPTDWRETLDQYQIHTIAGREKFLLDVVKAYERLYPGRFRFYLEQFKKLRQVMTDGGRWKDAKGRLYFTDHIPTEPLLYVQRWIPDFGRTEGDIEMLKRVWGDFVVTAKDRRRRTTLWSGGHKYEPPQYSSEEEETEAPHTEGSREGLDEEADDEGAASGGRSGDREEDGAGPAVGRPDLGNDDHEGRPGGAETVPDEHQPDPAPTV